MKRNKTVVTETSRDLAQILGLSESDAVEWDVRQSLTEKIIDTFKTKRLTVTGLAKDSRTSRARITRILKGDTWGISLDVLFRVLGAVGQRAEIRYKKVA